MAITLDKCVAPSCGGLLILQTNSTAICGSCSERQYYSDGTWKLSGSYGKGSAFDEYMQSETTQEDIRRSKSRERGRDGLD